MADEFEFRDDAPPPEPSASRGTPKRLVRFTAALRANPGRWARWPHQSKNSEGADKMRWAINTGRMKSLGDGFLARPDEDDPTIIWVAYIGEHGDYAPDDQ